MRTLTIPFIALTGALLLRAAAAETAPVPGKAEEVYKNIQVFKGYPADQLLPAMQFMSAVLGEDCEFCHVDRAPEKDDNEHKRIARQMIKMTLAINRDHFEGKQEVTCASCHRAEHHPRTFPVVAAAAPAPEVEPAPAGTPPPALPAAGDVLDRYLRAAGGADAFAKLATRVQRGTITGLGDAPAPIEILGKAPGKRVSIVKGPRGESRTAFDGEHGWTGRVGRPAREMEGAEIDGARLDARFALPVELKGLAGELRTRRGEKIEGRDTVRVVASSAGAPPLDLWFDVESGLLVRMRRYAATPIGRNPTEIDYGDYREVDGVKLPFLWSVARPNGRFTIKIDETHHGEPVGDSAFAKPPEPASEGPK